MTPLAFHSAARLELRESVEYYNQRRPGLGEDFLAEAERVLERLTAHPLQGHPLSDTVRKMRISRFPYDVVYRIEKERVLVVAVMHHRRRPAYWNDRL